MLNNKLSRFMSGGLAVILLMACTEEQAPSPGEAQVRHVRLALNWVPEPEFGGFYAAEIRGLYARHQLEVEILPGGPGSPVVQMVAAGQAEFGIASADEILMARSRGMDLVALFATYQTCPQGIMVHASRGLASLEQVFRARETEGPLTVALEPGLPYRQFLRQKYGFAAIREVPYAGGIAPFLADESFAQQCFIFSEPLAARREGADPQVFLVAEAGYNPYTGVVVTRWDLVHSELATVRAFVEAIHEGWAAYLEDPAPANAVMGKLNRTMDPETFAAAAEAQKPLLESEETEQAGLGLMTAARWRKLGEQLVALGLIASSPPPEECFVDASTSTMAR
ncbi:MAG: ABC transporter substrate-binding protein [Planctomycetota bacterium]